MDERGKYKNLVPKSREKQELPKESGYKYFQKIANIPSHIKSPQSFLKSNKKMSYKSGNPLKKILPTNKTIIKVG